MSDGTRVSKPTRARVAADRAETGSSGVFLGLASEWLRRRPARV